MWSNSKLSKLNFKTLSQGGNGAGRGGAGWNLPSPTRSPNFNPRPIPELHTRAKISPIPDLVGSPNPVGAPVGTRTTAKDRTPVYILKALTAIFLTRINRVLRSNKNERNQSKDCCVV